MLLSSLLLSLVVGSAAADIAFEPHAGVNTAGNITAGTGSCAHACEFLKLALSPQQIILAGDESYDDTNKHWSAQQSVTRPVCRALPTSADDVSEILRALKEAQCQFAVKSGGHAAHEGSSNIDGGVTIDMRNFNQITVSADKTQTRVGAGRKWAETYQHLDTMGLSVVGGRVADIGVGGLLLGGGISFYSGRYGFACDNVINYEVVFADGTVNDVNPSTHPDLYFALRGGGNNFAIVTNFDLFTFPQDDIWGGKQYFMESEQDAVLSAFYHYNFQSATDPYAAVLMGLVWTPDMWIGYTDLHYTRATDASGPQIFENFTSLATISSALSVMPMSAAALVMNATVVNGERQTFWTFTFKNDLALTRAIADICVEEVEKIATSIDGFVPACVYQSISTPMFESSSKNGGNPMGLSPDDGPLTVFLLAFQWHSVTDDAAVLDLCRTIIARSNATAHERDLAHPYLYLNYASAEQDVFAGYGAVNLQRLKDVRSAYDPEGWWGRLWPGGFKF